MPTTTIPNLLPGRQWVRARRRSDGFVAKDGAMVAWSDADVAHYVLPTIDAGGGLRSITVPVGADLWEIASIAGDAPAWDDVVIDDGPIGSVVGGKGIEIEVKAVDLG